MANVPSPALPNYKDRRSGLMAFGVIEIILGALAALMAPFALLGAIMARRMPGAMALPFRYVIWQVVLYVLVAVCFIVLGVGSLKCRRWARALVLVLSWIWLIAGVFGLIILGLTLPATMRAMSTRGAQPMPPGMEAVVMVFAIGFGAIFYVVLPVILVLFYGGENTRLTCVYRDPTPRWTDRVRPRVLFAVVALWMSAFFSLVSAILMPAAPAFGRLLTGVAGFAAMVVIASILLLLGIGMYRLKMGAWWATVALIVLGTASNLLTWRRVDMMKMYEMMGMGEEQMALARLNPMTNPQVMMYFSLAAAIAMIAYLVWIREDFVAPPVPAPAAP